MNRNKPGQDIDILLQKSLYQLHRFVMRFIQGATRITEPKFKIHINIVLIISIIKRQKIWIIIPLDIMRF